MKFIVVVFTVLLSGSLAAAWDNFASPSEYTSANGGKGKGSKGGKGTKGKGTKAGKGEDVCECPDGFELEEVNVYQCVPVASMVPAAPQTCVLDSDCPRPGNSNMVCCETNDNDTERQCKPCVSCASGQFVAVTCCAFAGPGVLCNEGDRCCKCGPENNDFFCTASDTCPTGCPS